MHKGGRPRSRIILALCVFSLRYSVGSTWLRSRKILVVQSNLTKATTQNTKTEWSLTRIEPQGAFSEKRSRYICFMEDNLLHAMSKKRHV